MDIKTVFRYLWAPILFGALGVFLGNCLGKSDDSDVLQELIEVREEIEVVNTRNSSLRAALQRTEHDKRVLSELIASLKNSPKEIEYITTVQTQLVPAEPVVVYAELPEFYTHSLYPDVSVAAFKQLGSDYVFETYTLDFRNTLVLTENNSSASLQIKSSLEDIWVDVPVSLDVTRIQDTQILAPEVGLGAMFSTRTFRPAPVLVFPILHPTDSIDIATPYIAIDIQSPAIGIQPISYNLGDPLPILSNLWISPTVDIGFDTTASFGISLHSKL